MPDRYAIALRQGERAIEIEAPEPDWVLDQLRDLRPFIEAADLGSTGGAATRKVDQPPRARKRSRGMPGRAAKNPDLESRLTREVRAKLQRYVAERAAAFDRAQPAQAAILATFLTDELDWEGVDHDDLYTIYTAMGYPVPRNIRSQLLNAQQRAGYFSGVRDGKYRLSHAGENFARHESKGSGK